MITYSDCAIKVGGVDFGAGDTAGKRELDYAIVLEGQEVDAGTVERSREHGRALGQCSIDLTLHSGAFLDALRVLLPWDARMRSVLLRRVRYVGGRKAARAARRLWASAPEVEITTRDGVTRGRCIVTSETRDGARIALVVPWGRP